MDASISVVIPAYNRAHTIARAIASVQRQSHPPLEIIVVDDASTDDTRAVAAGLDDPRIRILGLDRNHGPAGARNAGVEAAKGRWIAFLDSDDEWAAAKLERQLAALDAAHGLASVTGYVIRDARHEAVAEFRPRPRHVAPAGLVLGCAVSPGTTLLAARELFLSVGPFDPRLRRLEDWDWLMRLTRSYPLVVVPEPLATIHKGGDPAPQHVASAVAHIRRRHREHWYRRSWLAGRKFDSTLLVEEASGAFYAGDRRRTAFIVARALAAYPLRGRAFFAMLAKRAARPDRSR